MGHPHNKAYCSGPHLTTYLEKGYGTLITGTYKHNAHWDTHILVLTFPSLQSSKIAVIPHT